MLDKGLVTADEASPSIVKPGLTNLIPKTKIKMRGDIIQRNISIR